MSRSLLAHYPRKTDRFDEMLDERGQLRPSWQTFFDHLDNATPAQMRHQRDYVRRRIQENGVIRFTIPPAFRITGIGSLQMGDGPLPKQRFP